MKIPLQPIFGISLLFAFLVSCISFVDTKEVGVVYDVECGCVETGHACLHGQSIAYLKIFQGSGVERDVVEVIIRAFLVWIHVTSIIVRLKARYRHRGTVPPDFGIAGIRAASGTVEIDDGLHEVHPWRGDGDGLCR